MWLVWTGGNDRFWDGMGKPTLGGFDLLKIVAPPPGKDMDRQQPLVLAGLVNEPCFDRRAAGRRSIALRPQARHAAHRLPARSVRQRAEISRREDRRARRDLSRWLGPADRLLFRRADRHPWPAPVHQSRFRRRGEGEVGREALLRRPRLFQRPHPHQAVSRRHVLRLLPRRAEPDQSAGRSRQSAVRQPQLDGRRAIYVGRPAVHGRAQQGELHVPAGADLSPRRDGHLAGLHRQHQQPAHHERGLQPQGPPGDGQAHRPRGAEWRREEQQAVQRIRRLRISDPVLQEARTRCGRRAS